MEIVLLCLVVWESMIIIAQAIEKRINRRMDPVAVDARYQLTKRL